MALVSAAYASSSSSDEDDGVNLSESIRASHSPATSRSVVSAPALPQQMVVENGLVSANTKTLQYNVKADVMWAPLSGPDHPNSQGSVAPTNNTLNGYVQGTVINDCHFDEQLYAHQRTLPSRSSLKVLKKRKRRGDPADVEGGFLGPWASYEEEEHLDIEPEIEHVPAPVELKKARPEKPKETTKFHGTSLTDYQGRTYMWHPSSMKAAPDLKCYIPKTLLHTWTGHSKGVNAIRFFPKSGHLLLSCSIDTKIKLWDVHNDRKCLRTFLGHSQPVRDICFSNDGRRFLSASYDKYVKLWDTETGTCIARYTTKQTPYCVKFNPDDNKQNEFLVGQSDRRIVQWDVSTGEQVQTYEEHLGAVNSILFVDNNRRFLSTSDDKKVLVWEYGIPVVIKHISEPDMHSMPATALHPSGKFFVGQSLDNQVLVFGCLDRFKLNRKKRFTGHQVAGYAAQVNFSPDGRFVMSGDAEGRCFFWDWKTSRCYRKLKCHDQVTIGCEWNPAEASRVATCSWDGTIKYWD